MKKSQRRASLALASLSLVGVGIGGISTASAGTPPYYQHQQAYDYSSQATCLSQKASAEARANSGGNHLSWISNTGCFKTPEGWDYGSFSYSATHMIDHSDRFIGWGYAAAMKTIHNEFTGE